ncbi:transcriptional initiation protein Tat [Corallococcus sp. H22C18031201]|nr:transcriptional initiation protein Tat [Corallococcus sp. H22C18031201]
MKKTPPDELRPARRTFLKAAAGFMGSTLLGGVPFRAFAQATNLAPPDRCFVFVYFAGGWDQLLAFDPRDPDEFTPDRVTETRILPGYSLLSTDTRFQTKPLIPAEKSGVGRSNIAFGPAVGRLADHYDLMTVVRGINMTTLGHEVGYRYFLTGKQPNGSAARGSSTATEIVGQMKPTVPIASIAYNIESYNDRYGGYANALRVSGLNDLVLTLSPSTRQLDSDIEKQLIDFNGQPISCEEAAYGARGVGTTYENSRGQMGAVMANKLSDAFKFQTATEAGGLLDFYGLRNQAFPFNSAAGRAATVATALKKGISQCVSINLTGGLDTHFGTQLTHASNLRVGFDALALLVDDLRRTSHPGGGNFMDHTTIMVFSEFARTPLINSQGGRDHHLCSSCMLMGAGVKHNYVFGRSGDIGMAPGTFDLRTGAADPNGTNIFPEHVIATVLASANLDYSITRVDPLRPILA